MLIYTNTKPRKKLKQKTKAQKQQYADWLNSANPSGKKFKSEFKPLVVKTQPARPGADDYKNWKSVEGSTGVLAKTSIMDPFNLRKESPEVQEAITAKSKRIAIAYNKGGYVYMTDDTDPTTLGSSERRK